MNNTNTPRQSYFLSRMTFLPKKFLSGKVLSKRQHVAFKLLASTIAAFLLWLIPTHVNAQFTSLTNETRVNTTVAGDQWDYWWSIRTVAVQPDGGYIIVWIDVSGLDGQGQGIFGQRFDASGEKVGPEFLVNTITSGDQFSPTIAVAPDGSFIVGWEGPGSGTDVFAQRFDKNGVKVGTEFLLSTTVVGSQRYPEIQFFSDGTYVAAFVDGNQTVLQKFGADDRSRGVETRIISGAGDAVVMDALNVMPDGRVLQAWTSANDVYAQLFDSNLQPIGVQTRLNSYITDVQRYVVVRVDGVGNIWAVWESNGQDGSGYGAYVRRFDSNLNPYGPEFAISTSTANNQYGLTLAVAPNGRTIIAWGDNNNRDGGGTAGGDSGTSVWIREFDTNGNPVGVETRVNQSTAGYQDWPVIDMNASGRFVVDWEGNGTQAGQIDNYGVFARAYQLSLTGTTAMSVPPAAKVASDLVTVTMTLTAPSNIANVKPNCPSVSGTNGVFATLVSGPSPESATVGTTPVSFTWTYRVTTKDEPGTLTFGGNATAIGGAIFPYATSNAISVSPALYLSDLTAPNLVNDSNNPDAAPTVFTIGAKMTNAGLSHLSDVTLYLGDGVTPGNFPVTTMTLAQTNNTYQGSFALEPLPGGSDCTRPMISLKPSKMVLAGGIDFDGNGVVNSLDDGILGNGKTVIDGRIDVNLDGSPTTADDLPRPPGVFYDYREPAIIDGYVDSNRDGIISALDNGTFGGETCNVYWQVKYQNKDAFGKPTFGNCNDLVDDLRYHWVIWGTGKDENGTVRMDRVDEFAKVRCEISASANKISPNPGGYITGGPPRVIGGMVDVNMDGYITTADDGTYFGKQVIDGKVDMNNSGTITTADDGVLNSFPVIDGFIDFDKNGSIGAADDGIMLQTGQTFSLTVHNATFGNVGAGFDENRDNLWDYDCWYQPIGKTDWPSASFRLIDIQSDITGGTGAANPLAGITNHYDNEPYLSRLIGDLSGTFNGTYTYTFLAMAPGDGMLTPYQEAASGSNNEKYNGDYGIGVRVTTGLPGLTLDMTVSPATVTTCSSTNWNMSYQNIGTTAAGEPLAGNGVVIEDVVPANTAFVAGSATCGTYPCTIYYSADDGATWATTAPPAEDVNRLRWHINQPVPPNGIGTVSFQTSIDETPVGTVITNQAEIKLGTHQVIGTASASATVVADCPEICDNGIDDDEDGIIDNFDLDCFNYGNCNNTPGQNDITGSVFFDPNGNLTFDDGEYTQPNVSISLYKDNNLDGNIGPGDDLVGSKETNAAGQYSFAVTPTYDFSNNYKIPSGCNDGRDGSNNETRLQFGKDRNIGLRFTGINIPSGANITNARLVFVANTNQNNTGSVDIYAHKTANPPDFCSNSNVNLRTRTTAKTAWTVGGWTNGSTYQSADIKNVLQEMTSTYGAYNNGTLALIMISTGSNNVEAKSFENNSALAPRLLIEYSIGGVQYIVKVEASTLPPYMQLTSPNSKTVLLTALGTSSCNNNFAFKKAQESCSNGLDDDGDGFIDCADTDCNFNLAASAGPSVGICSGGNTTLTASATGGVAPYTFSWSSGLGTGASKTVNPSTTTTYTVTVTSANGCTATNQVMVSVVPKPTITAEPTDATICTGGTNVLSVTATGGTPFLTYQWQSSLTGNNGINSWSDIPGAISNSYATAPLMVNTYYRVVVSANGNGCASATSVGAKITVVPSPTITSHPASAAVCSGGAQTLTVTANGGVSGPSYQWQSSSNNLTFTNIGGATSSSYTTPLLSSTMYYRVVVSASGNGCGSIISNAATVTVVPAPAIVTQPAATNVCMNGSGTFTVVASGGTPSLTYQWQKSTDNISFSNISGAVSSSLNTGALTASTYYRVMVGANGSGCATVTSASALASVSTLSTSAGSNMTICAGSPTTLSASATGGVSPYAFTWSNGLGIGETKTVSPTSQTTYTVTVTSANGCTSSAQVVVSTNPIPNVNAGANKTICTGTTTTISATASGASSPYIFTWNNGLGAGASKTVTPSATTTYIVTVTSNNGCIGTGATTITVNNCVEICNNSLDDDGDGLIDCADSDCGPVADATNNLSICPGTPALLTTTVMGGNAPYTYSWNNGLGAGANKTVTPTITTTYGVTVTSASGCTSTDQVTVTIMPCGENCTNGIDDDFDGLIDCADPDCAGVTAPVLVADTYSTCPGMTFSERVTYNDANLNNPAFSIASNPQYGTVTIDATGKFTYVPTGFQCVTDYFIYQVCNQVSGCCQTATVTLNLSDSTPPVLMNVPADLTISCDDAFPSAGNVTAFDQCPGVFMDYTEASSQSYIGDCGSYVITKTWKATDFCGNQTTGVQLVNVVDQVKPEIFRVYTLANGTRVAAGVVQKVTNEWKYVKLPITFSQKPLLFAQVSSNGEFSAVNVQLRNIYTQGFEVRLREEEAADGKHGIETVSWIAMEPGSQNDEFKFQAGLFDNANDTLKTLSFGTQFQTNPHFFASVQTTNETDPVSIRTTGLNTSGVQFFLQEETSADAETKHASEKMGYLAIRSTSRLLDKKGEAFGELGTINLSNAWATVTLTGKYTKPVVVMGALTNNDGQPVNVRVRNVGQNSFQVRLQEWDYQDGIHATEGICWMVVEGGLPANTTQYCFGNANDLVPGVNIFAVDNCDDQVTFTYTEAPVANDFGLMLTNRSWAAVDDCGNTVFLSRNDTCRVAAVKLKSSLNGAMVGSGNSNLMRDDLRVKSYVPAVQPYSAIPAFSGQTINYGETEFGNDVEMVITANSTPPPPSPPGPPSTPYDNLSFAYKSIANGEWSSATTWKDGVVPPQNITSGAPIIRIDHHVTIQSGNLSVGGGAAIYVLNGGKLQLNTGSISIDTDGQCTFDNAALVLISGNSDMLHSTARLWIKNSSVYVAGNFRNTAGKRTLRGVCITVGGNFINQAAVDSLENVCATVSSFSLSSGAVTHAVSSSFKCLIGDFKLNANCTLSGSNLTIWTTLGSILSNVNGTWTASVSKYCSFGLVTGINASLLPAASSCSSIDADFTSCNCTVPLTSSGSGGGTGVYSTLTPDFKTIANGLWSSPATWFNGLVPPVGDISSKVVKITHAVTLQNSNLNLKSNTALIVEDGSLTMSNGDFIIQDANAYFINAAFTSPLGELTMDNTAAKLEMFNCQVSINEQFKNRKGKRRLQNVCLTLNDDFINDNGVDTLLNLCAIITKEFKNFNGGNSFLYDTKLKLNTGKLENGTGSTMSGDRNIVWVAANDLINNGTWKCIMDEYCVSGNVTVPQTYRPIIDACGLIQANFTPCNCSNSPTSYVENSTLTAPVPNPFVAVGKMDVALLETTGDKSVVDWVMVELRNANNDKQVIKAITALTCRDGEIVSEEGDPVLYFPGVPEGNYYVVLKHRNHLGMMTDVPFYLTTINTPTLDFMDLSLPVRGGNSAGRLSSGKRNLWGGDYNGDGKVVYQGPYNDVFNLFSRVVGDSQNSENLANYIVPGYELQDFNLDGKTIYQGPGNDRGAMLFNSILSHPLNVALLANYIALDAVP